MCNAVQQCLAANNILLMCKGNRAFLLLVRRGSRINADRFPQRAPKTQASWGVQGHAPPVNVLDFNSLKSPFSGFRVTQIGYWPVPFTLDKALQLGKFFIY